jgi:nucleoside-diphosphate-sugar epimerase
VTTLVTGAGLIGAAFARHALKRGEEIVFLDPFAHAGFLESRLGKRSYALVAEDVRNLAALVDVMTSRGIDTVVHTAGRIGQKAASPLHEGFSLNVGGAQAVAEAVRLTGVGRLVHISTLAVYDWARPMPEPITEDFPVGPSAAYSNFKIAQEMVLDAYMRKYGFELVILRPANVYGHGQFWAGSSGGQKVRNLVHAGLTGGTAHVPVQQTMPFEYIYADDVGRAADCAATCTKPSHTTFNIGTGVSTSFDELLGAVKSKLTHVKVEITGEATSSPARIQCLDSSRARQQLGWSPLFSLETGIEDYVADMRRSLA